MIRSKILLTRIIFLLFFLVVTSASSRADPHLPHLFSDNMMFQRDRPMHVWGKADPRERIRVSFNGNKAATRADKTGNWSVNLPAMPFGGPYTLIVTGKKKALKFTNVLVGDVWVCSGQSNMEFALRSARNAGEEIEHSNHPSIRLFTVERAMSYLPRSDLKGGPWTECNPNTSGDFSAVAYFFARKLHQDLRIPIGLIHTSWGGTNIQTWISWDSMSKKDRYKNVNLEEMERNRAGMEERLKKFHAALSSDKGMAGKWFDPATATDDWRPIRIPQLWEQTGIGDADGIVWFRKDFELSAAPAGGPIRLSLGPIDDIDITWVNGHRVGSMNVWNTDRLYTVDPSWLHAGKNTIVVKVTDNGGGGGIYGDPQQLFLNLADKKIPLSGTWLYKASVLSTQFGIQNLNPNSFPSQLFNAMLAPLIPFPIEGAIWYQGEANTYDAYAYRKMFPQMISDWRHRWGYDFPFFWVQLANFMKPVSQPAPSEWAELREAQNMTLSVPGTGQAVIIDIGEANDIHPKNKQDVGLRLALAALKVAYGKDLVYSGPVYESMAIEGNSIRLRFSHTGSGLIAKDKYGYLKGFAVAGNDHHFVWARARIEGNDVIVHSDSVAFPVAVRYAWADNPDANLYNVEGLPASPFRTDVWPGSTVDRD